MSGVLSQKPQVSVMSKIASLSAKLREKDAEKSKILNEVKDLEALKSQNIVGQLSFVVTSIGTISSEFTIDLKVSPSECNLSVVKLTNLSTEKEVELQLTSKNITIEVVCKKSNSDKVYTAVFDLVEAPDNDSLSLQLDGTTEGEASIPIKVKATYDTVEGLVASKQLELKQVDQEIQAIAEELKKATVQQNPTTKPKKGKQSTTKKSKQSTKQQPQQQQQEQVGDVDGIEEALGDGESGAGSMLSTIAQNVLQGVQVAFNHRAVLLFGVAAFAIYSQGEMVSV